MLAHGMASTQVFTVLHKNKCVQLRVAITDTLETLRYISHVAVRTGTLVHSFTLVLHTDIPDCTFKIKPKHKGFT